MPDTLPPNGDRQGNTRDTNPTFHSTIAKSSMSETGSARAQAVPACVERCIRESQIHNVSGRLREACIGSLAARALRARFVLSW